MIGQDGLDGLRTICPKATVMREGGIDYIFLPSITVQTSKGNHALDALLCPTAHPTGYMTRLFLAKSFPECGRSNNWGQFRILERDWHSWSWQNVPATLTPAQILAAHLRALQ
jgi:hypothetical protein